MPSGAGRRRVLRRTPGSNAKGGMEMVAHEDGRKQEVFAWIVIAAIFGMSAISFYLLWAKTV